MSLLNEDARTCTCASTQVGRCGGAEDGDGLACRAEEKACPIEDQGVPLPDVLPPRDHSTCKCTGLEVHEFSTDTDHFHRTLYGGCVNRQTNHHYCVMFSHMCADDEEWFSPEEMENVFDVSCGCPHVRVGACLHDGGTECAVDADSCIVGSVTTDETTTTTAAVAAAQEDASNNMFLTNMSFIKPGEAMDKGLVCLLCGTAEMHAAAHSHHQGKVTATTVARLNKQEQKEEATTVPKSRHAATVATLVLLTVALAITNTLLFRKTRRLQKQANNSNQRRRDEDSTKKDEESFDEHYAGEFT